MKWTQARRYVLRAGVITAVLASTNLTAVQAATSSMAVVSKQETVVSREKAIQIAQSVFEVPAGYKGPEVSFDSWDGEAVWSVSWQTANSPYNSIDVEIDADSGSILSASKRDRTPSKVTFPPKVSYEQATEAAKTWLKKIMGKKAGDYRLEAAEYDQPTVLRDPSDTYHTLFTLLQNGVPFESGNVMIRIDGNGDLVSFRSHAPAGDVTFQDPKEILSADEAKKLIEQNLTMQLVYSRLMDAPKPSSQNQIILSYAPTASFPAFDAQSGKPINPRGDMISENANEEVPVGQITPGTSPAKRGPLSTEKEAIAVFESFSPIPDGVVIRAVHKEEDHYLTPNAIWSIELEYRNKRDSISWTGAQIDAGTGAVLRFTMTPYQEEIQEQKENKSALQPPFPITEEKAREKALRLLSQRHAEDLDEFYWDNREPVIETYADEDSPEPFYYFQFKRKVNGILMLDDSLRITISALTGEIVDYRERLTDVQSLPKPDKIITAEQAKAVYLQDARYELQYYLAKEKPNQTENENIHAKLIYRLVHPWSTMFYIDATTGKMIDYDTGKELARAAGGTAAIPEDIKGHPAERELQHFLLIGVIQPENNLVHPQKSVTRSQFLEMLVKTERGESNIAYSYKDRLAESTPSFSDVDKAHPSYGLIEWALQRKYIEKHGSAFEPDRPITREEAAEITVNALGYGKLADRQALFQLPFQDAQDITYKGHVAIVNDLGLLKGSAQAFKPKAPLTRADAAILLYRFLVNKAEYMLMD